MRDRLEVVRWSLAERDRRWKLTRAEMEKRGLDCLVLWGWPAVWDSSNANARYLSPIRGNSEFNIVVFPLKGEPTTFVMMPTFLEGWRAAQDWITDIRAKSGTWADSVVGRLSELGLTKGRIGMDGLAGPLDADGWVPHSVYERMKELVPEAELDGQLPDAEEASKRPIDARAALVADLERLGNEHPDVLRARRKIAALEEEVHRLRAVPSKTINQRPENPAYINLQAQLNSATSSLDALRKTRLDIKHRLQEYAKRLEKGPEIEPEYLVLTRDRDTSGQKYQDIRSRLLEAKVAEGLEVQRKGERFSLIDPPSLPEKPYKPNRLAIPLLGFILAVGGGAGLGAAAESLDHSIRTPDQIVALTQYFPLAVIPFMPNEEDVSHARLRRRVVHTAGIGAFATALLLLHVFVVPLDVLWFTALRRFGME